MYIYKMPNTTFVAIGSYDTISTGQIGYSTDSGLTWQVSTNTNGLFGGGVGEYHDGFGVAYGQNTFVAVGSNFTSLTGQIGYSLDKGLTWHISTNNGLFARSFGVGIAYEQNTFVASGISTNGNGQIGYSTDKGLTWQVSTNNSLFSNVGAYGSDIAYGQNTFVVVGQDGTNATGKIGYSTDKGLTWQVSSNNSLFGGGGGYGLGIAYGQNTFVAVGNNGTNTTGQIGYSLDKGLTWQLSTNNSLFGGGGGYGIAYGQNTFVAVGTNGTNNTGQIGYSTDSGLTWQVSTNNSLFSDFGGTGVAFDSVNNTFVAVGYNGTNTTGQIGYSTDRGLTWQVSTNNSLFGGGGGYGNGIAFATPEPTPPIPINNICFPAGTPIRTDQGFVNIEQIDTKRHTINKQPIKQITQTVTADKYLICFEKDALRKNVPDRKTVMSKDHQIEFDGQMVPAYRFLDVSRQVRKVKYSGEVLYNVLLHQHGKMSVNNLICETLHPENLIAKLYNTRSGEAYKNNIITQMNNSILTKDYATYKKIVNQL